MHQNIHCNSDYYIQMVDGVIVVESQSSQNYHPEILSGGGDPPISHTEILPRLNDQKI